MTHRYHPDPERNDPESAILYDDCERCDQQAEYPGSLDDAKLVQAYEASKQDDWTGTANQRKLLQFMYKQWVINERLDASGIRLP